ncbi:MAG: hypothetical protein OEW12_05680 [Deltaproteobacteria bacterium]|nr:hypothetical protein [Deltaproteobacteria bacterium]
MPRSIDGFGGWFSPSIPSNGKVMSDKPEFQLPDNQDFSRGTSLLVAGAVMVLLKWVLPFAAPFALTAYGGLQLYLKRYGEGIAALFIAILLWLLKDVFGGVLWLIGAGFAGTGLFFLILSLREEKD